MSSVSFIHWNTVCSENSKKMIIFGFILSKRIGVYHKKSEYVEKKNLSIIYLKENHGFIKLQLLLVLDFSQWNS